MLKRSLILYMLVILVSRISYSQDVLKLRTSHTFLGKVTAFNVKDSTISFKMDRKKYEIPASDINSIQFGDLNDLVYQSLLPQVEQDTLNNCAKGQQDAMDYHGKEIGHFALGFLFGPFAIIGTAIATQDPVKGARTASWSNNPELFSDAQYLKCYRSKAKAKLIGNELLGWGVWILIVLAA